MRLDWRFFPLILLCGLGCTGSLDDGPSTPGSPVSQCLGRPPEVAVPMRRLMPDEYQSALTTIFGAGVPDVTATYPVPTTGYDYSTFAEAHRVSEATAEALLVTAETVAEALGPTLPDCAGEAMDACARRVVTPWVTTAFRRPAEAADVDGLVALAVAAAGDGLAPNEALAVAIVALLNEPRFLYVVESRPGVASWSLDGHERAQRLALTFWRALPDDALTLDASIGALDASSGMSAATARLLADPRARDAFRHFVREWLGVGTKPPVHDAAVQAALEQELDLLIDEAWEADDGLASLLGSDVVYADTVLEGFYGLPATSSGPGDFRRTTMPGARIGLLTHPLVLAPVSHGDDSAPILRGKLLRTRVLCDELGTPPVGAAAREPMLAATATVRERYEARSMNSVCASCHRFLDPVGFGLERWDGLGRYRDDIDGRPVDELADVLDGGDVTGSYAGGAELLGAIASSDDVASCFARQWTEYALGRDEGLDTFCSGSALGTTFRDGGRSIPAMLQAFGESPALVSRLAEVTP